MPAQQAGTCILDSAGRKGSARAGCIAKVLANSYDETWVTLRRVFISLHDVYEETETPTQRIVAEAPPMLCAKDAALGDGAQIRK
jgi:hypothetical protein